MRPNSVLYLVPDLYGTPGGIARHARLVCRVLTEAGAGLEVVALHDVRAPEGNAAKAVPAMSYHPCGGRRAEFVRSALLALCRRPDLVVVEHAYHCHLGWLLAGLSGARLVVFAHGIEVWDPLSSLRRLALRRADRLFCVSRFTGNRVVEANGVPVQRTRVIHHCLPPEFAVRADPEEMPSRPSLLTVARINSAEKYKGHDQVIRALPALLPRFPELVYDVIGDGDGRAALEDLAAREGVAHAVRFRGNLSDEALARHYSQASLFVMPSRMEGFGFVFLEAMAYGKPVIAGNQDASVEVVRHGETGLVVDPTCVTELVAAIERLLSDTDLRQKMGTRAMEVAASDFGYTRFRDTLLYHLQDVCQPPPWHLRQTLRARRSQ